MAQTKPKAGQFFGVSDNGTDGQFLQTDGTGGMSWAAPIIQPTLTSIDYPGTQTAADPAGGESVIIYGTGFATGITCTVGGTSATTAFNSATQITITSPAKTAGQYTVEVTNTDGGTASQANFIQYSGVPVWSTASGSLGSVMEGGSASFQVTATEGSDTIEYAVTTGSLPSGLSLATATGAITGTAPSVSADTTSTFSITATDDENQTSSARSFSITVTNDVPSNYFNTVLYTGNKPSNNAITGVGFQPDFVWIKDRSATENHTLFDSVRGEYALESNTTNAQSDFTGYFSFDSDGFTVGDSGQINSASDNFVAWCFKAGGAPTATNSAGQTPTLGSKMVDGVADSSAFATVSNGYPTKQSINTNLDFSITEYTKTTSANSEIPHGLSGTPDLVIIKFINPGYLDQWQVWQSSMSTGSYLMLQDSAVVTSRADSFSAVNSTYVANNWTSGLQAQIMYSFKSKSGFSKSGSYTGNGNSNGPMIETGFEPAYIMVKEAVGTTNNWYIYDNKRSTSNPRNKLLAANNSDTESTNTSMNMNWYANGFQPIDTGGGMNRSGSTYVYLAMAADPSTTTPSLANSFQNFTWSGSGSAGTKTGLNFQPDTIFWKAYDSASYNWKAVDSVRGKSLNATTYNNLYPNLTNVQNSDNALSAINASSIEFSSGGNGNVNGLNYIGYSWKAGGLASINTDGSTTTLVSVNQAAGISVAQYTGTGSAATIAHGLGAVPKVTIIKGLTGTGRNWVVFHEDLTSYTYELYLSDSGSEYNSAGAMQAAAPTSTLISLGTDDYCNGSGNQYICYSFAEVTGFSSFGKYTASGSAGSPTITTGFQPDVVFMKNADRTQEWVVIDSARGLTQSINTNSASVQYTGNTISTNATSFTIDTSGGGINYASGDNFIYMAFKQN